MNKELTCIVCPMGCRLSVEMKSGEVIGVKGNTCPKGKAYAETECINPQRVITSTVRCSGGGVVSVKTDKTIPKDKMKECMEIINGKIADLPICVGDVIIKNVFGSDVVATQNKEYGRI